jgi:hypothetical protein
MTVKARVEGRARGALDDRVVGDADGGEVVVEDGANGGVCAGRESGAVRRGEGEGEGFVGLADGVAQDRNGDELLEFADREGELARGCGVVRVRSGRARDGGVAHGHRGDRRPRQAHGEEQRAAPGIALRPAHAGDADENRIRVVVVDDRHDGLGLGGDGPREGNERDLEVLDRLNLQVSDHFDRDRLRQFTGSECDCARDSTIVIG